MTGTLLDTMVFEGNAEAQKISQAITHLSHFLMHDCGYQTMAEAYVRTNLEGSGFRELITFTIKASELPHNIKEMLADIPNPKDQYLVLKESAKHTISAVAGKEIDSVILDIA
jgi:hypothetical protein